MRAVDCTTTVEPDEVVLEFDHAYVVDGECYAFNFQLSFRIEGLVAEAAEASEGSGQHLRVRLNPGGFRYSSAGATPSQV